MTLHSLPVFVRLAGRAVILLGDGEAAEPKQRLLERAGAIIVGEAGDAALAIVAIEDEADALAAVTRLKARGILVNAVDRPALCDFTLPAIVERAPVLIAIGTGGASAGLAAALRQRLEALLPAGLGSLAMALGAAREALRQRFPDMSERRRAISDALGGGGAIDVLGEHGAGAVDCWLSTAQARPDQTVTITLASADPDELTLRQARLLGAADRVYHPTEMSAAILERARADAARISTPPAGVLPGLTVILEMAR